MDRLIIDEELVDNVVVLKLRGIVDSGTAQFLEDKFNDLVSSNSVRIIADLGDVNYISSAGGVSSSARSRGSGSGKGTSSLRRCTPMCGKYSICSSSIRS